MSISHRVLTDGITLIQELGPSREGIGESALARGASWYTRGRSLHVPQNAYLVAGERTLLFDTLSPATGDGVVAALDRALDGRPLDYLAVSHPDVPHAGNAARILRAHPGARLVAPGMGHTHALYHLEDALKVVEGDEIDLGGRVVVFHEAPFLDAALSMWMSERTHGCLFTVDWLGLPLFDGEELCFLDEIADVDTDRMFEFHARVMFWFRYVDPDRVKREQRRVLERHRPLMLAPSHGPPVRSHIDAYVGRMDEVVDRVVETGRTGVL